MPAFVPILSTQGLTHDGLLRGVTSPHHAGARDRNKIRHVV